MMATEESTLSGQPREVEEAEPASVASATEKTEHVGRKKPNLKPPSRSGVASLGKDTGALPDLSLGDDADDEDSYTPSRPMLVEPSEVSRQERAQLLAEQEAEAQKIQEALDRDAERRRVMAQEQAETEPAEQQRTQVPVALKVFTVAALTVSGLTGAAYFLTVWGIF